MVADCAHRAPAPLPWRLIATLVGGGLPPLALAQVALPAPLGLAVTAAGMTAGALAAINARPGAAAVAHAAAAAGAACVALPVPAIGHAIGLSLAAGAGLEARRGPGRAFVAGLFGWLLFVLLPGGVDKPLWAVAAFALAGGWGIGLVAVAGLAGLGTRRQTAFSASRAGALGIYLFAGGSLSVALAALIGHPKAYWIAVLFVLRALEPWETRHRSTLRFALGASLGVGGALAIEALAPPLAVLLGVAAGCLVIGLRRAPVGGIAAPAAFSAAILLATAPTFDAGLMRLEAVLLAVGLALGLSSLVGRAWSWVMHGALDDALARDSP